MSPEAVLGRMIPAVETLLTAVVAQAVAAGEGSTLYDLEAMTQAVLPQLGQVVLRELAVAQGHPGGTRLVGPTRACGCGGEQAYHDQARPLVMQSSVGAIRLERLGLGQAGRMSRYLQEQCAWLMALLPGRLGQQTLARFGWPAVAASEVRAKGEALGAELGAAEQRRLAVVQAAALPTGQVAPRQPAQGGRLYAASDGLRSCTTAPPRSPARTRCKAAAAVRGLLVRPGAARPQRRDGLVLANRAALRPGAPALHPARPEHAGGDPQLRLCGRRPGGCDGSKRARV